MADQGKKTRTTKPNTSDNKAAPKQPGGALQTMTSEEKGLGIPNAKPVPITDTVVITSPKADANEQKEPEAFQGSQEPKSPVTVTSVEENSWLDPVSPAVGEENKDNIAANGPHRGLLNVADAELKFIGADGTDGSSSPTSETKQEVRVTQENAHEIFIKQLQTKMIGLKWLPRFKTFAYLTTAMVGPTLNEKEVLVYKIAEVKEVKEIAEEVRVLYKNNPDDPINKAALSILNGTISSDEIGKLAGEAKQGKAQNYDVSGKICAKIPESYFKTVPKKDLLIMTALNEAVFTQDNGEFCLFKQSTSDIMVSATDSDGILYTTTLGKVSDPAMLATIALNDPKMVNNIRHSLQLSKRADKITTIIANSTNTPVAQAAVDTAAQDVNEEKEPDVPIDVTLDTSLLANSPETQVTGSPELNEFLGQPKSDWFGLTAKAYNDMRKMESEMMGLIRFEDFTRKSMGDRLRINALEFSEGAIPEPVGEFKEQEAMFSLETKGDSLGSVQVDAEEVKSAEKVLVNVDPSSYSTSFAQKNYQLLIALQRLKKRPGKSFRFDEGLSQYGSYKIGKFLTIMLVSKKPGLREMAESFLEGLGISSDEYLSEERKHVMGWSDHDFASLINKELDYEQETHDIQKVDIRNGIISERAQEQLIRIAKTHGLASHEHLSELSPAELDKLIKNEWTRELIRQELRGDKYQLPEERNAAFQQVEGESTEAYDKRIGELKQQEKEIDSVITTKLTTLEKVLEARQLLRTTSSEQYTMHVLGNMLANVGNSVLEMARVSGTHINTDNATLLEGMGNNWIPGSPELSEQIDLRVEAEIVKKDPTPMEAYKRKLLLLEYAIKQPALASYMTRDGNYQLKAKQGGREFRFEYTRGHTKTLETAIKRLKAVINDKQHQKLTGDKPTNYSSIITQSLSTLGRMFRNCFRSTEAADRAYHLALMRRIRVYSGKIKKARDGLIGREIGPNINHARHPIDKNGLWHGSDRINTFGPVQSAEQQQDNRVRMASLQETMKMTGAVWAANEHLLPQALAKYRNTRLENGGIMSNMYRMATRLWEGHLDKPRQRPSKQRRERRNKRLQRKSNPNLFAWSGTKSLQKGQKDVRIVTVTGLGATNTDEANTDEANTDEAKHFTKDKMKPSISRRTSR